MDGTEQITVAPATPGTWDDVTELLGRRGAVKGCWCMWFRQSPQERRETGDAERREALKGLVDAGAPTGLVAYRGGKPAGWVSVAPYGDFSRLGRSPVSKPVDDTPVWSLVCLYVGREHRGAGVARALVRAGVDYARDGGAKVVEAYPVDDALGPVAADDAYHGLVSLLAAEGFTEVARRTPKRPVMRVAVG
ncbi:hypothetical protein SRB5_56410 [Streptomyces sp. RB5]|uniref:N-acetyltransferase domain-containing protein n=1 Tax=Streptomyces smaragdinus TaxID=2585196 RepID=A0A7K0CPT6_9ACTN|nr:GNAT family N-acetyltransferase [Streptomyces smaragdinus]MQY15459.1 hypothetical protein [Streptomyces smaragdinus]